MESNASHPDPQYRNISVGLLDLLRLKTEPHRNTEERRDAHVSCAFKRKKKDIKTQIAFVHRQTRLVQNDLFLQVLPTFIFQT